MCDTVFALGENDSFHLECPSRWFHQGLTGTIKSLFDNNAIASVYSLCLGFGGAYVICYKDKAGLIQLTSSNIPKTLSEWLYHKSLTGTNSRDFAHIRVTLGPGGKAFFVTDGKNSIWGDLPLDLTSRLQSLIKNGKFTDTPRLVSLGVAGNWFMLTKGGMCYWNMPQYSEFGNLIPELAKKGMLSDITNFVLSPHKAGACVIALANGFAASDGLPASAETELQLMSTAIKSDTEKLEHANKVLEMERKGREIELLNMATKLAEQGIKNSQDSIDRMCGYVRVCSRCGRTSCFCI